MDPSTTGATHLDKQVIGRENRGYGCENDVFWGVVGPGGGLVGGI